MASSVDNCITPSYDCQGSKRMASFNSKFEPPQKRLRLRDSGSDSDQELERADENNDLISLLPKELVVAIFLRLNLATLGTVSRVCKNWKELANDPDIQKYVWKHVIYKELAFSSPKWANCFGEDVVKGENVKEEFSSFPFLDIIEEYKKFKIAFPGKNARESLMLVRLPKTLNGELTLNKLGELAKKYFPKKAAGYRYIWDVIVDQLGDKSIDKSRWVLMTTTVLDGSRNRNYVTQQKIVESLSAKGLIGYEIPETLEAAVCIFAQYFDSERRVFSDAPLMTYTRCKERVEYRQLTVGGFAPAGLFVCILSFDSDSVGVAALRKF